MGESLQDPERTQEWEALKGLALALNGRAVTSMVDDIYGNHVAAVSWLTPLIAPHSALIRRLRNLNVLHRNSPLTMSM